VCGALLVKVDLWLVLGCAAALALATLIAYRSAQPPSVPRPRHATSG
jgi:hypothetical protein